jgi:hypothetical protein
MIRRVGRILYNLGLLAIPVVIGVLVVIVAVMALSILAGAGWEFGRNN